MTKTSSTPSEREPLRALLVSDFTVTPLASQLDAAPGEIPIVATAAPFGQVSQVLLDPGHAGWKSSPDIAVVWTRPEAVIEGFAALAGGEEVDLDDLLAGVADFAAMVRNAAARTRAVVVPTWTRPGYDRGLGGRNFSPAGGIAYVLARMNICLSEQLADVANVFVLDAANWIAGVGPKASNPKLWYMGKIAFSPEVLGRAAIDIRAVVDSFLGLSRKLIVLDLDDTLWGGIVGEVGWENLQLGGHDPVGEAFADFHAILRRLKNRGILLAILSKNDEDVALEALANHPNTLLRPDDFVAWRIDWNDKAANMASLLEELNLLDNACVFIDDNPAERARIRESFPDALVPEWPEDKLLYASTLAALPCFDQVRLTDEDRRRTETYQSERKRRQAGENVGSMDEWMERLSLEVRVEPLGPANLPRATQLLNKTNQMNLRTRRMTEDEFRGWGEPENHHVLAFHVGDRFGDYGLTGIAGLVVDGDDAVIEDYLLSCRVMGRRVEQTMLHVLAQTARQAGARRLIAHPAETPRNHPCREFFASDSKMELGDGQYIWDLSQIYPEPGHVKITRQNGTTAK